MGFLDDLKGWFVRESKDARAWADDAVADGNAALDRAERRQAATPEERLQATLDDIEGDDSLAAVRDRIDRAQARADADEELAGGGADGRDEGPQAG